MVNIFIFLLPDPQYSDTVVQTEEGFIWENVTIFVKYLETSLYSGLFQFFPALEMALLFLDNANLMKMQNLAAVGMIFDHKLILEL